MEEAIVGNPFEVQEARLGCTMNMNGCDVDMLCE